MLDVLEMTEDRLKEGKYEDDLPELYKLETVIENNSGHNSQSVFDHTVKTFGALKGILKEHKTEREKPLLIAALLHDIGKKIALRAQKDGNTISFNHAEFGELEVPKFRERFGLTEDETEYIRKVVLLHDFAFSVVAPCNNPELQVIVRMCIPHQIPTYFMGRIQLTSSKALGGFRFRPSTEGARSVARSASWMVLHLLRFLKAISFDTTLYAVDILPPDFCSSRSDNVIFHITHLFSGRNEIITVLGGW